MLADDLADSRPPRSGRRPSLCGDWTVEEVVAHLTAAASIGRWRWIASMLGARFDPAVHNARRLAEHRGATPAETLELLPRRRHQHRRAHRAHGVPSSRI